MTEPLPPPPPLDEALLQLEVMSDFNLVDDEDAVEGATVAALLKLQRLQNRGLKICKGNYDRIPTIQLHTTS